jgi:hypothetical protein
MNIIRMTAALGVTLLLTGAIPAAPVPPEKPGWGTIKGQVTWEGKVPKGGPEEYLVNRKNKGVKNVFVWLIDASDPMKPKAPPINPNLKLDTAVPMTIQAGAPRRFEPHVVALGPRQSIIMKNTTAAADNVVYSGIDGMGACAVAPAAFVKLTPEDSRKPYSLRSNIFPVMNAWVRVFDHPYFAVTDSDGKFEIKGAPAGKFNIIMWHEGVGWVNGGKNGKPITIPAGKTVEVNEKAKADE